MSLFYLCILRALKKAELQLGIVSQQCEQVRRKKTILENKRAEQGVWLEGIRIKREEILKEVEVLRKSLSQTVRELLITIDWL